MAKRERIRRSERTAVALQHAKTFGAGQAVSQAYTNGWETRHSARKPWID